jgi:arylsulfatase A-like enzyme
MPTHLHRGFWLAALLLATLAGAAERPNLLVVLTDDHSAPHVGCYGNRDIRTPTLDRFASQGMRFDRAYVACPQCVPSRAALMTGRSPVGIQMTRFSAPLPREVVTYPELLRQAGYFTGVAGRSFHLDGSGNQPPATAEVFERDKLRTFPDRVDYAKSGNMLTQYVEFLDQVPAGRPFFLQLCSNDPHRPLTTSGPQRHDPATLTLPAHYPDTPAVRADFARYYDEIAHFDQEFATVLAELDRRGLAADTIVVVMGDNGASQLRGKGTLYEFGIRVPLIVRWPGRTSGAASGHLISGEDLAPTLLAAAGLPPAPGMTGRSFLPLLENQPYQPRTYVFAERGAHGSGLPGNSAIFDLGRCVVSPTHKLIYNATYHLPYSPVDFGGETFWKELVAMHAAGTLAPAFARMYFSPQRPLFELFDLGKDPHESTNLSGAPEVAAIEAELKTALHQWMIRERDYLPLPIAPGGR